MVSSEEKLKEHVVIWQFELPLTLSFEQIPVSNLQSDSHNGVNENEFLLAFRILFSESTHAHLYKYGDFSVTTGVYKKSSSKVQHVLADFLHVLKDPGYNLLSVVFVQYRGLFALEKVIYLRSWMVGRQLKSDIQYVIFMVIKTKCKR